MNPEGKTQLQMIIDQLNAAGEVSRNWCLQRYCSRLGARIEDLEKEGWIFKTETRKKSDEEQGDYIYKLVSRPQTVFNPQVYSVEFLERQEKEKTNEFNLRIKNMFPKKQLQEKCYDCGAYIDKINKVEVMDFNLNLYYQPESVRYFCGKCKKFYTKVKSYISGDRYFAEFEVDEKGKPIKPVLRD